MNNPAVLVAIVGGIVTLAGFVISGVFGLLSSTSERESAAAAGVEKALNERLTFKDEQLADCKGDLRECESERRELEKKVNEHELEIWELRGKVHSYEVAERGKGND